jgi:hypothetical protein
MRKTMRVREAAVFLAAALFLSLPSSAFAQQVGVASNLRTVATQAPPGGRPFELVRMAPIFRGAVLATSPRGALEVTFADGSRVSMGGASTVVVDQYVYAGPGGGGQQAVRYTKGFFRFISGQIPRDRVRQETPTVTIGIRGTVLRVAVNDDGATTVGVDDGAIDVTSKLTGRTITLQGGQRMMIDAAGAFGQLAFGKVEGCD